MSIYLGNTPLAGRIESGQLNNPFFFGMHIWSDTAITNASWLISNGFYHSGATYTSFYEWLLKIHNGTLTVDGVSVKAYSASDITDYDYVINTANTTFRLPLLDGSESIPDYNNREARTSGTTYTASKRGFFYGYSRLFEGNKALVTINGVQQSRYAGAYDVSGAPTNGSFYFEIGAGDTYSAVVSTGNAYFAPAKGNGFLYYYVGDTVQDASLINAGAVLGQLATKTNSVEAAAASMPSSRYIDLTLGASGATYTAPANGWFAAVGDPTDINGFIAFVQSDISIGTGTIVVPDTTYLETRTSICCSKGQRVEFHYRRMNITVFRFYYAEGDK